MSKKKKPISRRDLTQLTQTQELIFLSRSSPLPPPKELMEYEEIMPGITQKFMTAFEKQQDHRMELEKTVINNPDAERRGIKPSARINADISRMKLGQIFAFILGFTAILGGLVLLIRGLSIAGFSVLVGTTATLVGAFLYGKAENRKERENKARENPVIE